MNKGYQFTAEDELMIRAWAKRMKGASRREWLDVYLALAGRRGYIIFVKCTIRKYARLAVYYCKLAWWHVKFMLAQVAVLIWQALSGNK